jgi:hypothetical protein
MDLHTKIVGSRCGRPEEWAGGRGRGSCRAESLSIAPFHRKLASIVDIIFQKKNIMCACIIPVDITDRGASSSGR